MIAGTHAYRAKLERILGPAPTPNAVLCDMCMRWELGGGKHDRPERCARAKFAVLLASFLIFLAAHVTGWGGLAQAHYMARTGRAVDDQRGQ